MAPAALSLLTVTFTEAHERARAFGVYGAIAGSGAAIGLVLGGVLTQYASWRWTLLINTPIALIAAVMASRVIRESKVDVRHSYDLPGAVTSTAGLFLLVYGFTMVASHGWGSALVLSLLGAAVVLLATFVVIEMRVAHPLLPLKVVLERNRGGSFLASLFVGIRPARHVSLPDLLPPGHPRLQRSAHGFRLPALLGRHYLWRHAWLADYCLAPARETSWSAVFRWPPWALLWFSRLGVGQHLCRPRPRAGDPRQHRHGPRLRADELDRSLRRGRGQLPGSRVRW